MKRFFILLLTIVSCLGAATVELELENGSDGVEIGVGEPLRIKAVVSSKSDNAPDIEILGIDKFNILGKSTARNISLINGKFSSKTTHSYKIQADKVGQYLLGPAFIRDGGTKTTSNTLKINVKKEGCVSVATGYKQGKRVMFKLVASKDKVVLGEPLIITARFYYRGSALGQVSLSIPETPGFVTKESKQVQKGREVVDGLVYNVLSKRFVLTPIKSGTKEIPPIEATYAEAVSAGGGFFGGMFSDFMGSHLSQKKIASNALSIGVEDVPQVVDAVGSFKHFLVKVDSEEVNVNEPISLSVEIEGEGAFDHIESPKLTLSDVFNCYESKSKCDYEGDLSSGKKSFEYVLQGKEPGEWEIPSQKFTYFDIKSRGVKVLQSDPIRLTVNSVNGVAFKPVVKPPVVKKEKFRDDINFIEEDGALFTGSDNRMNIWIFLFLIIMPIILFVGRSVGIVYYFLRRRVVAIIWPHRPLIAAKKRLHVLQKEGNVKKLYQFILAFLSDKFNISDTVIGEDWIRKMLLKRDWPFEEIESFLEYFHRVAGLSFASFDKDKIDNDKLFSEALRWIRMIDSRAFNEKIRG